MTHVLSTINNKEILEIRPLDEVEYNEYILAVAALSEVAKNHELFMMVHSSYEEYKNVLDECLKTHCKNSNIIGTYLEGMILNINRLVLNFLSSVRTFLDHTESNIKKKYGDDSETFRDFKKNRSSFYDNCFAYRFLYVLRNYSQHVGMPITSLRATSEMTNQNSQSAHRLKTITLRDELLKYDKWKKIRDEISRFPEEIDIDPFIDEMMYCIKEISITLYGKEKFIDLLEHTTFLDRLVQEKTSKDGIPCIVSLDKDYSNSENCRLIIERFPLNAMEIVDLLNLNKYMN